MDKLKLRQICFLFAAVLPVAKLIIYPSTLSYYAKNDLLLSAGLNFLAEGIVIALVMWLSSRTDRTLFDLLRYTFGETAAIDIRRRQRHHAHKNDDQEQNVVDQKLVHSRKFLFLSNNLPRPVAFCFIKGRPGGYGDQKTVFQARCRIYSQTRSRDYKGLRPSSDRGTNGLSHNARLD